jgi:hypothetical protein
MIELVGNVGGLVEDEQGDAGEAADVFHDAGQGDEAGAVGKDGGVLMDAIAPDFDA